MFNSTSLKSLESLLGQESVSTEPDDIAAHSYDAWPVAVKWRQQGKAPMQPEAIVRPRTMKQVGAILAWATAEKVPVTAWGAGSAVTGAALAASGGITLDLSLLNRTLEINTTNATVRAEAGKLGHHLEQEVNQAGFTLNHSPQSLDRSTIGGWLATRSSGQFSSRWGSIEDLCVSFTVALADGTIVEMPVAPRMATGPDLRHLFIGSEGVLGVVTDLTLRMFELPEKRVYETVLFDALDDGLRAVRRIMQRGLQPFLLRLYDADEAPHAMVDPAVGQPVLFLGCEGPTPFARAGMAACLELCENERGHPVGPAAAEAWMGRRFDFSAIEKTLSRPGGYAETIEVAASWDRLDRVYEEMKDALAPLADEVLGHFSHAYSDGASLYLILLGSCENDSVAEERLLQIWDAAMPACMAAGGAISHHHGIGRARRKYLEGYLGEAYFLLKGIKNAIDPKGILNPGKLV